MLDLKIIVNNIYHHKKSGEKLFQQFKKAAKFRNPEEDQKMAQDDYQELIAGGIANGIDAYYQ